ncbi:TPA: acyltransferase family protein [Streptococcus suis]|nr:acyltransferase family protein [Streptococcus suis]
MEKTRSNGIDFLRIVSCVAVILIHTNYYFFKDEIYQPNLGLNYLVESFINIVTRFSVPVFVMISGALNLSKERNSNFSYFYKKTFLRVFLPVLIAMVPMMVFEFLYSYLSKNDILFSLQKLLHSVLIGDFFNLWFIYMLAGLYWLTPFVIKLKSILSQKDYVRFVIVLLVWAVFSQMFSNQGAAWSMGLVFAYLAYYMMGDILRESSFRISGRILLFVSMLTITITFFVRFSGVDYYLESPYTGFFSPTLVVFSLAMFSYFSRVNFPVSFHRLSNLTFYIYIFHTFVLRVVLATLKSKVHQPEILEILIFTFIIFFISTLIAKIYQALFDKTISCTFKK